MHIQTRWVRLLLAIALIAPFAANPSRGIAVTAPEIGPVRITSLLPTKATIYYETDVPAVGYIDYGLTSNLGRVRPTSTPPSVSTHAIVLSPLKPNTLYYYRARAANDAGQDVTTISTFRTPTTSSTGRIEITKTNSDQTKVLTGACFDLFKDAGSGKLGAFIANYCDQFDETANDGKVVFPAVAAGSYVLVESRSPLQYALARNTRISVVAGQVLPITVTDPRGGTRVYLTLVDEDENPVPDACFSVYQNVDGEFGKYVAWGCDSYDDLDGVTALGGLRSGDYFIYQETGPDGYVFAERISVTAARRVSRLDVEVHTFSEAAGDNLEFRSISGSGGFIPGACFALFGNDDSLTACDGWDGNLDGRTFFINVPPGDYLAIEYHAPDGYAAGKRLSLTKVDNVFKRYRFTQVPGGRQVQIKTLIGNTNTMLPGACYEIFLKNSASGPWPLIAFWCDSQDGANDGVTKLDGIKAGVYLLRQYFTPAGYVRPADLTIVVESTTLKLLIRTFAGANAAEVGSGPVPYLNASQANEHIPTPAPTATPTPTSTAIPSPTETPTPEPTPTEIPSASPVA